MTTAAEALANIPTVEQFAQSGVIGSNAPVPIGVEEGFSGPDRGVAGDNRGVKPPGYFEGDEQEITYWSPERVWQMQQQLASVGLLEGSFRQGVADRQTVSAFKDLLGYANQFGNGVPEVKGDLGLVRTLRALRDTPELVAADREIGGTGSSGAPLVRRDPAAIALEARESMRSLLGRDPTPRELQEVAGQLTGLYNQASEQQQALGSAQAGDITLVDPGARFQGYLEERFRPEVDRIAWMDEALQSRESVMSNIGAIDRMMG